MLCVSAVILGADSMLIVVMQVSSGLSEQRFARLLGAEARAGRTSSWDHDL